MSKKHAVGNILSLAIAIFSLALIGGLFTPVHAGHITCGAILPGPAHVLDSNVGPCDNDTGSSAIEVLSSRRHRTTLDLNGFTVFCEDTNGDTLLPNGIVVDGDRAEIFDTAPTLTSGVIGCNPGVFIFGNRNKVNGITSSDNIGVGGHGFLIVGINNNVVGSDGLNNDGDGFNITGNQNVLFLNTGGDNGQNGFRINAGQGNRLSNNFGNSNDQDGFLIQGDLNGLVSNHAEDNVANGFEITGETNTLIDNQSIGNTGDGFFIVGNSNILRGDDRHADTGNVAEDNQREGFLIVGDSNRLRENRAVHNRDGFAIDGNNNILRGKRRNAPGNNIAEFNTDEGFDIAGNNNIVTGNNALQNDDNGFATGPGTGNILTRNMAENSGDRGFLIFSDSNTLTQNTAESNSFGIEINDGFVGNRIINNTTTGNTILDLSDKNGECTSNTWNANTFGTSNPACIN